MKILCSLMFLLFLVGCAHRLGTEIITYDDINRSPTPIDVNISIYDSREDVPFDYKVIGQVFAAPMRMERDLGYNPVEMLKEQAREIGGIGLLNVSKGEGDSRNEYSAKVLAKN